MTISFPWLRRCPLAAGLMLAVAVIGCRSRPPSAEDAAPQAPVRAEPARKAFLGEWTDLLGTTQVLPNRSARISAAVEGHVLTVLGDGKGSEVVEGQQVNAGQVIVRLDDRVPRANRVKLRATLNDLAEQEKQAGYALELATIDTNRLKGLVRGGSSGGSLVSQVELQKAQVLQKDAQSKKKAVAEKQTAAQADLKALDEQLEFYTLRAPISGRLSTVQAVVGQTLTPGAVVADVVDLDQIDVLCYAPPDAAARLALDQRAKLLVQEAASAEPQQPPAGKVAFIAVQADPQTGNVPVKVRFPNPSLRLRAHTIVRVHVLTRPEKDRLTIPEAALMEDRDVPTVVAVQDVKTEKKGEEEKKVGKVRKLQVLVGIRDRERRVAEILGLEDPATKEKVAPASVLFVTAGGYGLQDGDSVELAEEDRKEAK